MPPSATGTANNPDRTVLTNYPSSQPTPEPIQVVGVRVGGGAEDDGGWFGGGVTMTGTG
jgi:hypothetical protein